MIHLRADILSLHAVFPFSKMFGPGRNVPASGLQAIGNNPLGRKVPYHTSAHDGLAAARSESPATRKHLLAAVQERMGIQPFGSLDSC
jgi:hypothetical protein